MRRQDRGAGPRMEHDEQPEEAACRERETARILLLSIVPQFDPARITLLPSAACCLFRPAPRFGFRNPNHPSSTRGDGGHRVTLGRPPPHDPSGQLLQAHTGRRWPEFRPAALAVRGIRP